MGAPFNNGPRCLECKKYAGQSGKRWLCVGCFADRAIREKYPTKHGTTKYGEPTEAELNQMIAEQMRCLPPWWHESQKRFQEGDANE